MSLVQEIFESLWETDLNYKGMRVNIFGVPKFDDYSQRSIRSTIDRLSREGFVQKYNNGIQITQQGKQHYRNRYLKNFSKPINISKDKNLIVIFDIPEGEREKRDWLRDTLKDFDYIMIQKSVWVGPSPLPEKFVAYFKEIGIKDCVKTFKLSKSYKGK